ncbi:ABC transporter permease subunit [Micromonospora sp. NPDC049559]|uniref:ABC transporter permease subunit n=1 Tax=Micromonospora sp. NPDC049559 TaxID=3155923 RepID=UPI00342DFB8E
MSLVKTELRRLFKRRLVRLLLVLLVLGLAAIAVTFSVASHRIGPAQLAAAEARADTEFQQQLRYHQQWVSECEAAKARGEDITNRYPPDCDRENGPTRENFRAEWYLPYQFDFRGQFDVFIAIFSGLLALVAFIVGASFVGAEWHTGGMMNLLLWRPRRLSVLLTKLGVLLGTLLGLGLVLGALWTLAFWLIGRYDGVTGRLTPGVWTSFALSGARGLGLVLAVGAVAFGLASLGRHTAMALGAAIGVGALSEVGLRIAVEVAGVRFGERYLLSTYALAWFQKRLSLPDWRSCNFSVGECRPDELIVTWQQSGLLFGAGTVLVLVAAMWAMRRRDIT